MIVVIMPAFDEAGKIGNVLGAMPERVGQSPVEVVVVDDGSTDETPVMATGHGATVLRQNSNQGKGAAVRRGLDHVANWDIDALVWMDADGQHLPESIPALIEPVLRGEVDLCVGSRYLGNAQPSNAPLNRRLVRSATIRAIERLTGFRPTDPYSGFRCFSQRARESVGLEGSRYECELESTFAVARAGLEIGEVPIPRIYGADTSKMSDLGRAKVIAGYVRTLWRARRLTAQTPVEVLV